MTPVDYKHGHPREGADGLELWPSDRAQLAVQGIVLRENGYRCEEGIVYYRKTGQRVRVAFDEALIAETEALILEAWATGGGRARFRRRWWIRRSVRAARWWASACRTRRWRGARGRRSRSRSSWRCSSVPRRKPVKREVRRADDAAQRIASAVSEHARACAWGRSGAVLQVKEKDKLVQEVRIGEICQVNLMGNVQISTQAVQALCEAEVPICYFSMGGWFYGITTGLNQKNVFLRRSQFRLAEQEYFARTLARRLVAGKIRNQRTLLQRNHVEPNRQTLAGMKEMADARRGRGRWRSCWGSRGTRRGCTSGNSRG